jgi:hypothetical protein
MLSMFFSSFHIWAKLLKASVPGSGVSMRLHSRPIAGSLRSELEAHTRFGEIA